jgi:DNA repair exonuclease SbcCD ATPase subunit
VTSELTTQQLDEIATRAASLHEYALLADEPFQADADQLTGEDVPALLAEVRRLRSEQDEQQSEIEKLARWRREDETVLAEMRATISRLRDEKRALGELAARRESELIGRRAAMEKIRHLHKDSPMGPCPVCIDADAAAAGGDGLVPYPCPTGRLAGAQDCDPPHVTAAVSSVV